MLPRGHLPCQLRRAALGSRGLRTPETSESALPIAGAGDASPLTPGLLGRTPGVRPSLLWRITGFRAVRGEGVLGFAPLFWMTSVRLAAVCAYSVDCKHECIAGAILQIGVFCVLLRC
ncbi:hypothetical protein NDU88_004100 [Pleurodeles waltl]|uniref:Uncharacterized protein n=1 Tax=Pleurodeles waltl TaxID=8319 RepID=A0AAV7M6L2_PLEWA|nr:hypothetical protein NDU88_004100 [Pleurodeles waltl]